MKEKLKEMVYNDGLHILLDRLSILYSNYELEKLLHPVIVKATIVDMDSVISKIKEKWHTCFNLEFVVRETKIILVSHITRKYATLSTQQEFK